MKLFVLFLLSFAGAAHANQITVKCEGDLATMQFTMNDFDSIQDYSFAFKEVEPLKGEIKLPTKLGNGLYDVNPFANSDEFVLQLPPYAAREDVTQFMTEYSVDLAEGTQTHHYRDDVFCVKQ